MVQLIWLKYDTWKKSIMPCTQPAVHNTLSRKGEPIIGLPAAPTLKASLYWSVSYCVVGMLNKKQRYVGRLHRSKLACQPNAQNGPNSRICQWRNKQMLLYPVGRSMVVANWKIRLMHFDKAPWFFILTLFWEGIKGKSANASTEIGYKQGI